MPTIASLTIYPIKSCAGIDLHEATLTPSGLSTGQVADREWMVVDLAGRFLSQRELPRMALLRPALTEQALMLTMPGQLPFALPYAHQVDAASVRVSVWDDSVDACDGGDGAAAWISAALGVACRLVRFAPHALRLTGQRWTGGAGAPTRFADGYPLLVIGAASLEDINTRLRQAGRAALPMNRFRPNLVLAGLEAFEEDYVAQFEIGEAVICPVKPCPRCPIPSVDQATGVPGPDPLDVLQAYRRKALLDDAVCVGMNCVVSAGAGTVLVVGQSVDGHLAFD
ncbi:MOSC domain-containing protein [Massilia sp. DWR3-1-1]|uniref:MOSC domain-containing protein n=1 Tax=Massilia sp. DWR3-1-1 TaxID=2804559 RepID=UPI003CE989A7